MPPLSSRVYTKDELHNFMTLFPDIVRDLTYLDCYANVPSVNLNLSKVCCAPLLRTTVMIKSSNF